MGVFRDYVDAGVTYAQTARSFCSAAQTHLNNAGDHISANEWALANADIHNATASFGSMAAYLMRANWYTESFVAQIRESLYWVDDNWPSNGVTMDAILTAMLSASNEQLTAWMGITDAYKCAVWDAPFNAEYYAALARGFKQW